MKRVSWIAAMLLSGALSATASAVPVSDVQNFSSDGTPTNFDFGGPLPPLLIDSITLDLSGVFDGPGIGFYALGVDWTLDGLAVGSTPFTIGIGPDPGAFAFNLDPATFAASLADGQAVLVGTATGGFIGPFGSFSGTIGTGTQGAMLTVNVIPEPSTTLLFLCGVLGAGAAARKKRLAAQADAA